MSGFSPDWLAMREPYDARARNPGVLAAVAGGACLIRVHDVLPVVEALQVFSAIQSFASEIPSTQTE